MPSAPTANWAAGLCAYNCSALVGPRYGGLGREGYDGHPQRFGGLGGRGLVRVPYTMQIAVPKATAISRTRISACRGRPRWRVGRHSGAWSAIRSCAENSWRRAAQPDERLVDDGSVFVLSTGGGALGCPLRWVSRPAHTFRVGLRGGPVNAVVHDNF